MSAAGPSRGVARSAWVRGGLRMMHAPAREPVRCSPRNFDPSGCSVAANVASGGVVP